MDRKRTYLRHVKINLNKEQNEQERAAILSFSVVPVILRFLHLFVRFSSKLDGVVGDESILMRISQSVRPMDVNVHGLVQVRFFYHQIHSFLGHSQLPRNSGRVMISFLRCDIVAACTNVSSTPSTLICAWVRKPLTFSSDTQWKCAGPPRHR